jgi:hypothetical protein
LRISSAELIHASRAEIAPMLRDDEADGAGETEA